jgi:hypothetical protein
MDSLSDPLSPEDFAANISGDTARLNSSHSGWSADLPTQIEEDAELPQYHEETEDASDLEGCEPAEAKLDCTYLSCFSPMR